MALLRRCASHPRARRQRTRGQRSGRLPSYGSSLGWPVGVAPGAWPMNDDRIEQLILMSRRRLRARGPSLSAAAKRVLRKLDSLMGALHETDRLSELRAAVTLAKGVRCRVIDSIRGEGPKLIEVIRRDVPALRAAFPVLD